MNDTTKSTAQTQEWLLISESQYSKPGSFPQVYTVVEAAEEDLPAAVDRVKERIRKDHLETCERWTPEDWEKLFNAPLRDTSETLRAVTWEQWELMERKHLLGDNPLKPESYREFMHALEVLPPKAHSDELGFEAFLMREHLTGNYTTQHACLRHEGKNICACRLVDAYDKDTWITRSEVMEMYLSGKVPEMLFSARDIDRALKESDHPGMKWSVPLSDKEEYNSLYMACCVALINEDTGDQYVERVEDIELARDDSVNELFWTIYAYRKDGLCDAVADFRTRLEAERMFSILNDELCNPYK